LIFKPFLSDELPQELLPVTESISYTDLSSNAESTLGNQTSESSRDGQIRRLNTAHSLALRDPNYDFWVLVSRKFRLPLANVDNELTVKERGTFRAKYLRRHFDEISLMLEEEYYGYVHELLDKDSRLESEMVTDNMKISLVRYLYPNPFIR